MSMKAILLYFLAGALGAVVVIFSIHFYQDHAALHAIINMINQNAKQQAAPAK